MTKLKQVLAHIDPQGIKTEFKPIFVGEVAQIESFRDKFNNKDLYLTPNYFNESATTHKSECVALIKQLTIDFDLRLLANDEETKHAIAYHLALFSHTKEIPPIHKVVSSGRGLYIVFMIDNETNLRAYNSIGKALAKKIERILADFNPLIALDPKSKKIDYKTIHANWIFRLDGSINSKSGEVVKVIYEGFRTEPYSFRELTDYTGYTEKQKEYILNSFGSYQDNDFKPRHRKLPPHFTEYSLYTLRVRDLETLQALRKANNYHIGYRNTMLFYYGVALRIQIQDTREIEQAMREFNSDYQYPLSESELRATIKSVFNKKHNIKNETMIDNLDIFKAEQRALETIIGYSVKKERKQALNKKAYKNTKDTNKAHREQRNALIVQMKQENPNITQKEIADSLGINQATVSRALKEANL